MKNQQEKKGLNKEINPEEERDCFEDWTGNLRLFFGACEHSHAGLTYDLMNSFYRDRLDKTVIDLKGKSTSSDAIEQLCYDCSFDSYDTGLRIGYAFAHYLDEPLRKFKEEAGNIGNQQIKRLKETFKKFREEAGGIL